MRFSLHRAILAMAILCVIDLTGQIPGEPPAQTLSLAKKRNEQDLTTWAHEVEAQKFEAVIIDFWDRLRNASSAKHLEVFASLDVDRIYLKPWAPKMRALDLGVAVTTLDSVAPTTALSPTAWRDWLRRRQSEGYKLLQSEWHHDKFTPATKAANPQSVVAFEIHVVKEGKLTTPLIVKGKLEIDWNKERQPKTIRVSECRIVHRKGGTLFQKTLQIAPEEVIPGAGVSLAPVIVQDLNGDRYPEVILGGVNSIFWNQGNFKFERSALFANPTGPVLNTGVVADMTGDGRLDFLGVLANGKSQLLPGIEGGRFSDKAQQPWKELAKGPSAITTGDVDSDGDLDVWLTQYKIPYEGGQMPTPFYDANDGYPSSLFLNNGTGKFTDGTVKAGLASKRNRRTYSASFVDLDSDRDLDLMVVSDFAGLDVWMNDGKGKFTAAPDDLFGERHAFGMAHTFGDFDSDGRQDLYMVGMSSTTARRLDQLGLKREDYPEYTKLRAPMAYGNRMYVAREGQYVQTPLNQDCARAGWAWGAASFDLENDGDDDLYVANGHISGKSATDYCTAFWRHDLYTGSSTEDPAVAHLLSDRFLPPSLRGLQTGRISWNGFEHNRLFLNHQGTSLTDVGFLLGVSHEKDCRSVVAADLDADGRQDLLIVENGWSHEKKLTGIQALLIHRNMAPSGHWLGIDLVGSVGHSPIGAKVSLHGPFGIKERHLMTGDSFYAQHPTIAHFGLGDITTVEKATVSWPDGRVSTIAIEELDRYLKIQAPDA
ncbi:MAG: hypothetical protein GWQ08_12415 [Verrucomicrobiaceae bacterium]|nr:hypothetical protein [Verrucomicrobiaceae bacterium]